VKAPRIPQLPTIQVLLNRCTTPAGWAALDAAGVGRVGSGRERKFESVHRHREGAIPAYVVEGCGRDGLSGKLLLEHDVFRKPVATFRHHALAWQPEHSAPHRPRPRANLAAEVIAAGHDPVVPVMAGNAANMVAPDHDAPDAGPGRWPAVARPRAGGIEASISHAELLAHPPTAPGARANIRTERLLAHTIRLRFRGGRSKQAGNCDGEKDARFHVNSHSSKARRICRH
jgi:hypothetical protein